MQKLTHEHVKEQFELRDWKLLDTYSRNVTPMRAICPEGHETTVSWCNLKKGQGCKFCAGNVRIAYEEVAAHFESEGCKLLETTYQNNQIPLKFRCICGSVSKVRFGDFKRGIRCKYCKPERLADHFRTPIEKVQSFFKEHDCVLLEEVYKDNRTKLEYKCKCGNITSATFSNFQKCPNCWECGNKKKSGDKCHLWNPDRAAVRRNKRYRKTCGNILGRALEASNSQKTDNTYVLLGYHARDLCRHIRNHASYKGEKGLQIDHIFPIKAFMDYKVFDLKLINMLENLQPLYGKGNQVKADKYDRKQFETWLGKHGILLEEGCSK